MFTDIIDDSLHKLVYALEKRLEQLTHYGKCIIFLPKGADENIVICIFAYSGKFVFRKRNKHKGTNGCYEIKQKYSYKQVKHPVRLRFNNQKNFRQYPLLQSRHR